MYTFPELLRTIRDRADLTQAEFAKKLGVSAVLVAMIESNQKEVSKAFIIKLAHVMEVHPSSITPFIFLMKNEGGTLERSLTKWGVKMQTLLVEKKAKQLKRNAK